MRSLYFDRAGTPLGEADGAAALGTDRSVAKTTLPDGKFISTVHLVIDHSFGEGPPLIFETMVFQSRELMSELDAERYSTEAEAREGHARMVAKWTAGGAS